MTETAVNWSIISNISSSGQQSSKVKYGCTFPDVDPFDPVVMAYNEINPPITCTGGIPHLVYLDKDVIKVNHSKTPLVENKGNSFKECKYTSVARKPGSDFETVVLYTSEPFNDSITLRNSDDNLVVECYGNNSTVLSRSYFALIRVKQDLETLLEENFKKHQAIHATKEVFNILMIGIDGTSKQNFQRQMPKTRNYLLNILNATELHKHNKLGDNTFPNVVPLLTGQPSTYLHRNNWTWEDHFDRVNEDFIWSDFHKAGYRTGLYFDHKIVTAFHYEKKGWDKSPVDYYHRSTILMQKDDIKMTKRNQNCVGDIPEITYNHNFWIRMTSTFNNSHTKPYFGFSFSMRLTHENQNMASAGDELYFRFLQELKDRNIVNNTIIVFFSDHGSRFGMSRTTQIGMIESNTPYMFLIFPPWFHRKYPDLMTVLKINQERLTTNYDLYETLRDLLNFQANTGFGDVTKRGISLFQEIPRERTCQHVGIPDRFCNCIQLVRTNISSDLVLTLAGAVMDKLKVVSHEHNKCIELSLKSVQGVLTLQTTENHGETKQSKYRIIITTSPNAALYEAIISVSNSTMQVLGELIRLNLYRSQAWCMPDVSLKPFCFCRP